MKRRWIMLALSGLLVCSALVLVFRGPSSPGTDDLRTGEAAGPPGEAPPGRHPAKTQRQPALPDPSIEDTMRLLHATVLPRFEIEDHSLAEALVHLDGLLREEGISRRQLRLVPHPALQTSDAHRIKALQLVDSTLPAVLNEICAQSDTTFEVTAATVTLLPGVDAKLDSMCIPSIDFQQITLVEARDFLRSRTRELDTDELEPTRRGILFTIRGPDSARERTIRSFKARNLTIRQALEAITLRTGTRWELSAEGVDFLPLENPERDTSTHVFRKLDRITVPRIDFDNTTLEEALDFLRQRSRELDPAADPALRGVGFVLRKSRPGDPATVEPLDQEAPRDPSRGYPDSPITFQAENVSLTEVLDRITLETGMFWTIRDGRVTILPLH